MPFVSPLSELCPLEDDHRKNNRQGEAGSVDPHHPRVLQDFGAQWNIRNIAGEYSVKSQLNMLCQHASSQMTTYWAVPMYKFLGYRDTILDKYEPLKVRGELFVTGQQPICSWSRLITCLLFPHLEIPG